MIHDWDGNGKTDDMFDDLMDYMMVTGGFDTDDEDEDEDYDSE